MFSLSIKSDSVGTPRTIAHQAPLSMGFPRQEHWGGLPFPSPGDLPDPGWNLHLLHWQADSLPLSHLGSPLSRYRRALNPETHQINHFSSHYLNPPSPCCCHDSKSMLVDQPTFVIHFSIPRASLLAQRLESACNAGDLGSIPGSGRSPGEGNGNPPQYSCLESPMGRGTWWAIVHGVAKSWT